MTMKHFCFLLLFAMTAVLSAAAKPAATSSTTTAKPATTTTAKPATTTKPAATTTAKPATAAKPAEAAKPAAEAPVVSVLDSIYTTNREPSEFADPEKAGSLLSRRAELVRKIQDERKRILKEDPKAKELNEDIMRQLRQLASILETKKSMIELNYQLNELDDAISRLKPAPAPGSESKDTKKEDSGKAGNADKTGKAGKE